MDKYVVSLVYFITNGTITGEDVATFDTETKAIQYANKNKSLFIAEARKDMASDKQITAVQINIELFEGGDDYKGIVWSTELLSR